MGLVDYKIIGSCSITGATLEGDELYTRVGENLPPQ